MFRMENDGTADHDNRHQSYSTEGSSDSSDDITVTGKHDDLDGSYDQGYTVKMDAASRPPIFIVGEEEGMISAQGLAKNIDSHKIVVGVCAMAKKTNSKPMKEILGRLKKFEHLQMIVFDEAMIISDPVENWPVVDALISFFSNGFPLQKAIEYKNLRKPFVVNDLEAQYILFDRREVYKILVREGIAHPRYAIMNRDNLDEDKFDENEDAIEVNGVTFQRPFVEKPVCAEDHNIYIYFPVSAGGGCQRLFRKVGSRSSVYSTINRVRKSGSYIYEDFMPTDGTDVKVYTVGPDYAHAEARKSPALDGKVERDKDGKEIRYPVLLSASEKLTARKVCMAFKQNVCGFDLLRANGKSYVCDVNGFSFVKNSTKYYDDCANVLGTMIVRALAPQLHIPLILGAAPEDIPVVHTTSGSMMELRCVVAVIRHGDRTPKQKMKMEVKHQKFFKLFEKYGGFKSGHLKLKKPKQLQEILDIARDLLHESDQDHNPEVQEKKAKLRQLKLVLEMYEFSGINRKIQLKYQPQGRPPESSDDEHPKEPSLVLIVKWGGELTPAGKFQAEDLGKAFRTLYPGGQGEFETPGLGFLRLHSTFRHDLKIYASDEGRVQMTAAAFTKGLLALEGELTPILVSMVKSANTNGLLDKEGETSKYQHVVKEKLMEMLNEDREFTEKDTEKLCPSDSASLLNAIKFIENPRKMCDRVYEMVQEITAKIKTLKMELKSRDLKLYHGESWELLIRRWAKLEKDFKLKSGNYDVSKIPDIYDCIKYDLQHNQKTLQYDRAEELFMCSKALADIVIPQEYGIKVEEKLHISQSICTPLLRKIHSDLLQVCQQNAEEEGTRLNSKYSKGVSSPERFVRTRLYFTSESHIHSLLNMFRYGGLFDATKDEQWKKATDFLSNTAELNYMTQINIMMFEDPSKEFTSPERFHIELHFSPGAYTSCDTDVMNPLSSGYRTYFLYRQKMKHEDEQAENTKKDVKKEGMKEGVIHQTISEEESDHSKEDSENNQFETRSGLTKRGAMTVPVPTPVILIDPSEMRNKELQKEKSPKAAKSDTEIIKGGKFAVTDVDESTEVFSATATADSSVSEQTLCPESLDDLAIKDSLKTLKDSKEMLNSSLSEKTIKMETSMEKIMNVEPVKGDNTMVEVMADKSTLTKQDEKSDEKKTEEGLKKRKRSSVTFDLEGAQDVAKDSRPAAKVPEASKDGLQKVPIASKDTDDTIATVDGVQVGDDVQQAKEAGKEDVLGGGMFTMGSQDNLEDLVGSLHEDDDTLEIPNDDDDDKNVAGKSLEVQGTSDIPQPKSPDPDIPEWDWGDPAQDKKTGAKDKVPTTLDYIADNESLTPKATEKTDGSSDHMPSPTAVSKPLTIQVKSSKERKRTGSFDSLKTYEEGRSRSLEDKSDDGIEYIEKHYLTIHLPINKDRHHHSFSSLLYLNPEAFKDVHLMPPQYLLGSYSAPDLSENVDFENQAFDGFNMVPSLKPLETLHNNLTLKDMDGFLSRATTTKFFTPVSSPMYGATPLVSPRMPEVVRHKSGSGQSLASLPSSSSSSAGPSSPTSVSTPVDLYSKLKMFIIDSQKGDQDSYTDLEVQAANESDLPYGSSSSSSNSLSKSDSSCPGYISSSKFQNQTSVSDNQTKQSSLSSDKFALKESMKREEKARTRSGDEQLLKDDEQKTLTAKSPEAFQCLKPHSEQSEVVASTSKSPTSPPDKHSPQLAEPLKLDISEDNHKSAFKKVGKRFKMTHVPEDSLIRGNSGGNVNSSLVKESSISKDSKTSADKVVKSIENTGALSSTGEIAKPAKIESDEKEARTRQTSKVKEDLPVDSES